MQDERGFSLIELLVSVTIMLAVTGGIFAVMNPAHGTFQTQPEVADMQQRLRVGVDMLSKDIVMAGAGAYSGTQSGSLLGFFAPVLPYRQGGNPALDDGNGVFFSDRITMLYVPTTMAQTTISAAMPATSSELKVNDVPGCPANQPLDCPGGFTLGQIVLIYDDTGAFDTMEITEIQDQAGHLQHNQQGPLSKAYPADTTKIVSVKQHVYYRDTTTNQLMHYDGTAAGVGIPVVDNVVGLSFEYWGDPQPPVLRRPGTDQTVTYGPHPPALGVTSGSYWPAGTNCTIDVTGAGVNQQQVARLATLGSATAGLVKLNDSGNPATSFTDGPWCPAPNSPNRFDADLMRIRKITATVRVQSAIAALRGPAGTLFTNAGTSRGANSLAPDQEIKFDVTPRNLNLGR